MTSQLSDKASFQRPLDYCTPPLPSVVLVLVLDLFVSLLCCHDLFPVKYTGAWRPSNAESAEYFMRIWCRFFTRLFPFFLFSFPVRFYFVVTPLPSRRAARIDFVSCVSLMFSLSIFDDIRSELLGQLKSEDQDRHSYYTQLEHLARQMRELPLPTDSVNWRLNKVPSRFIWWPIDPFLAHARIRIGTKAAGIGNAAPAGSDAKDVRSGQRSSTTPRGTNPGAAEDRSKAGRHHQRHHSSIRKGKRTPQQWSLSGQCGCPSGMDDR